MRGEHTGASICAKAIKSELKKVFPETKFSVISSVFSGGDSVHVEYEDGPRQADVEKIIDKYQDGYFDGMQDLYVYNNHEDGLPRAKYVQLSRKISEKNDKLLKEIVCKRYNKKLEEFDRSYEPDLRREYYQLELASDLRNGIEILDLRLKEFYERIKDLVINHEV